MGLIGAIVVGATPGATVVAAASPAAATAAPSDPSTALKQTKLRPPAPQGFNYYGEAVAIEGDIAVVGEPGGDGAVPNSGVAWVYVREAGVWSLQAKLSNPSGREGEGFGRAVAISGDTIVVGAPMASFAQPYYGAAFVFTRSGSTWTEQATLSTEDDVGGIDYGFAVAIEDGTIVVGARLLSLGEQGTPPSGAAYVYVGSGMTWTLQARLVSDDGLNDVFGSDVAVDVDTIAVGAYTDDSPENSRTGAVYIFVRTDSVWAFQAKIIASDQSRGGYFGTELDLDGDTLVTVSEKEHHAYVFVRSGTQWTEQAILEPDDVVTQLGPAVAVRGNVALVGAPYGTSSSCERCGTTYVFVRVGGTWTQKAIIAPAGPRSGDQGYYFGASLDINRKKAIIGAWATADDSGEPYAGAAYIVRQLKQPT